MISVPDADEETKRKVREKIRHRLEYGALLGDENDEDKLILQEMGRIIRDEGIRDVVVPFDVVEPKSADRRGTGQFLRLIKVSAHANQYQRPILEMKDGSQYVLATYDDLKAAAEVWFSFEEAQAYKITDKSMRVFRKLKVIEPPHNEVGPTSHTKNVLAEVTGIGPKTTERLLTDLYDAGLIFKKQVKAPGQPFIYWTTPELRQKVMSQISATGEPQTELGQIKTKTGCPKYLGLNCPDLLETSIYSFFTNQDIIKTTMLKGIIRRHVDNHVESLVLGEEVISSISKIQTLVLNGVSKALDSDSLGHGKMSQIGEIEETKALDSDSLGQSENVPIGDGTVTEEVDEVEAKPKTGKIERPIPMKTKSLHLSEAHIQAVLTGTKTQTRRNPSYYSKQKYLPGDVVALIHGKDPTPNGYATITDVRKQRLGDITDEEAKAEGNYTAEGWPDVWKRFNRGAYDPDKEVYVLELEPKREPEPEHLEEEKRVFGLTLGYYESLGNGQLPTAEALAKDTGWPDDKARMVVGMLEQMGV